MATGRSRLHVGLNEKLMLLVKKLSTRVIMSEAVTNATRGIVKA